jgi:hypothetical protein
MLKISRSSLSMRSLSTRSYVVTSAVSIDDMGMDTVRATRSSSEGRVETRALACMRMRVDVDGKGGNVLGTYVWSNQDKIVI